MTQVHARPRVGATARIWPHVALLLLLGAGWAATVRADERGPTTPSDVQGVSAALDRVVDAKLAAQGVRAAMPSTDNEFLRRIYLDVLGTVPTSEEVAAFAAERSMDKRARKIDELLASEAYAEHQASFWFKTLTGLSVHQGRQREGEGGRYVTGEGGKNFHRWLADQVGKNRPYDEMVQDLITATGRTDENGAAGYMARWESDANNTAGAVARHFLGVQIQCAQCHDHMYEPDWKQKDFKGMAAFFALTSVRRVPEYAEIRKLRDEMGKKGAAKKGKGAALERPGAPKGDGTDDGASEGMDGPSGGMDGPATAMERREAAAKLQELRKYANIVEVEDARVNPRASSRLAERLRTAKRPELQARVELMGTTPKFWLGAEAADLPGISRRYLLARWITADDNPYFARALVNRMWGHFMGRGIVHPIDDFNSFQAPSHPEILDILAADFKAHGYDLKRLQRILLDTATYQRSSRWPTEEQPEPTLFAKAPIRPMDTEQLYFSLVRATGLETRLNQVTRRQGQAVQQAIFSTFTFVFDDDEGAAEEDFAGSIPQGLFLMNGELLQRALSGGRDMAGRAGQAGRRPNARVRQRPAQSMLEQLLRDKTSEATRVDTLYIRAYGREPDAAERSEAAHFVKAQGGGVTAYEDLFWAILNSAEFMTNH